MLVNKTIAAKLAGISRRTLYVHIEEKGISVIEDPSDGLEKIDISELERVYGLEKIATNRKKLAEASQEKNTAHKNEPPSHEVTPSHTEIRVKEQAKEIEKLNAIIELKDNAHEQRVVDLEGTIQEVREKAKTFQLLLEDNREKDNGPEAWEKQMKALEARIANQIAEQDKLAEARILSVKKTAAKRIKAAQAALEEEKNKGFFTNLFGK